MKTLKKIISVMVAMCCALAIVAVWEPATEVSALSNAEIMGAISVGAVGGKAYKGTTSDVHSPMEPQSVVYKFKTGRRLKVTITAKVFGKNLDGLRVCVWNSKNERLRGDDTSLKNWVYKGDEEYTYDKFTLNIPKGTYYIEFKQISTPEGVPYEISISGYINKTVNLKSAANNGSGTAIVKWTPVSGVDGYEIYRSTKKSKGYEKVGKVEGATKGQFVDNDVKTGKTYYYKVRAYDKTKGTQYTKYSSAKKVTVK